jgi:glutathione S-transferase
VSIELITPDQVSTMGQSATMRTLRFKLYHYPASRSARVKWMLHEMLGDDFEVEVVPLYEGRQYSPEYLAMNPNHGVPTLCLEFADGSKKYMHESGAMVAFLADAFPEKRLAPPPQDPSSRRADYQQMLYFGASWMDMMLWQIRLHEHLLPEGERDARTVVRYRAKFSGEVEPQLVARLTRADFICGDEFSAADCIIGHNVAWARGYGLCLAEPFRAYLSRLSKRPAFRAAFADADQFELEAPEEKREAGLFTG